MGKLLNFFEITVGGLLIIYILYLRLFRFNTIREIPENLVSLDHFRLVIYLLLFLFSFISFIISIRILLGKTPKYKFVFLKKIINLYEKSVESFMGFLGSVFPPHSGEQFLCKLGLFLWNTSTNHPKFLRITILLLFVAPRTIMIIAMCVDLFFIHKFHYIYNCSFVLLLPLFASAINRILTIYCESNCKVLDTIFSMADLETDDKFNTESYIHYYYHCEICNSYDYRVNQLGYKFTDEFINEQDKIHGELNLNWNREATMNYYIDAYDKLIDIYLFLILYREQKDKCLIYVPVCICFAYTLIWFYLLCITF